MTKNNTNTINNTNITNIKTNNININEIINNNTEINDIRKQNEFTNISFSKFKKSDVKKELLKNLLNSKIEQSCYWSAELICSCHFMDLWEIIILFYSKNIHIGNPKLIIYLDYRISHFKQIVSNGYTDQEIYLRNNEKIRKLFCEIICILCISKKYHSFNEIKVNYEDFNITNNCEKLKAPSVKYIDGLFQKDDPKELFIACNELAYNINSEGNNPIDACYWIEWIIEFEKICRLKKNKIKCVRRSFIPVESKLQMEIIWIIWDIFMNEAEKYSKLVQKIVKSALNLFCLKYTINNNKKRRSILYFIVKLFTEPLNLDIELIDFNEKERINHIIKNINKIYYQIKKNEVSPNTDYLFKNVDNNNLEKSLEKLEKMNNIGEFYIPRIDENSNNISNNNNTTNNNT